MMINRRVLFATSELIVILEFLAAAVGAMLFMFVAWLLR